MDNISDINDHIDQLSVSDSLCCRPEECSSYINDPTNHLKIIAQNIRSINANFDSFLTLLCRINLDCNVIVLTECWLKSNYAIPSIDGYPCFYTTHFLNQNDGVVLYVKNLETFSVVEPDFSDASCLVLKIGAEQAIICIYRSPSIADISNFLQSLNTLLTDLSSFKNIVIIGDINLDISCASSSNHISDYLNLVAFHGLLPAHTYPTRELACLDHVMLKTNSLALTVVIDSYVTDHNSVLLCLRQRKRPNTNIKTIRKINYDGVDSEIKNINFQPIYEHTDANQATNYFVNTIINIIRSHTTILRLPNHKRLLKPWMTAGMLRCMRNRDAMHKKLKLSPDNVTLKITYKRYRNYCTKILKKLKREFDRAELREAVNDNKKTWQVIKRVTNTEIPKIPTTDLLSSSSLPQQSVDSVNEYFVNIGRNLANAFPNHRDHQGSPRVSSSTLSPLHSFVMITTDEDEVEALLLSLKNDSAVGWDNISAKFLKRYKQWVVPPLTYIFNLCLNTGVFPLYLKKAIVHPIHKGGNRNCVNNYRPIAVLPAISKILERIINKRLIKYLEDKKLLSDNQFGFRRNKSTNNAVLELTNHIVKNIDAKKKVLSVFLDLKKAFDTVSFPDLVLKLEELGIRDLPLLILTDYLNNRTQCVKIKDYLSSELPVTFGVPQGSVVGPTLFLVYVNQLCNLLLQDGKITAFADDTVLTFTGDTWQDVFDTAQRGLDRVVNWLNDNQLTLNTEKTKILCFSLRQATQPPDSYFLIAHSCVRPNTVVCTCPTLARSHTIKYLGVTLDDNLSFKAHIDLLTARIRKLIFVFKTLRHVAEAQIVRRVYFALCQSLLSYCVSVWGGAPKTTLLKLERAQRAVLKVSTFRPILFPTEELYKCCKVLTVRQLFILSAVLLQHQSTPYLNITKRRKDLICQHYKCKYSFTKRFLCFQGPQLYNKLNRKLKFYSLPRSSLKKYLADFLLTVNYHDTECLLFSENNPP